MVRDRMGKLRYWKIFKYNDACHYEGIKTVHHPGSVQSMYRVGKQMRIAHDAGSAPGRLRYTRGVHRAADPR